MYKFTLAFRYLIRRRISYFAVAAVALCVFVVFVVITVLTGISSEFKGKVHSSTGDCVVHTRSLVGFGYYDEFVQKLRREPYVEAASPVVKNYGFVSSSIQGIDKAGVPKSIQEIVGIEPVSFSKVTGFEDWIEYHKGDVANVFRPSYDANLPGCVPGIDFIFSRDEWGNYNVPERPIKGSLEVSCVPLTAKGALARAGTGEFNSKTFYYSDHFKAGYSLDRKCVFLPIGDVQLLCGMATGLKRITHIYIKFKEGVGLDSGTEKVKELWNNFVSSKAGAGYENLLQEVEVQSWKDFSRVITALVETQQTMMIVCFVILGTITVFIVLVIFYMIVSHKTKDIGILKSVGASGFNVLSLFLSFAFFIGLAGSAIGALLGWRFLVHINAIEDWLYQRFEFQLWDRQISSIGDIPSNIDLKVLVVIILSATAACMVGAILPAWRAGRMKCVDTIQVAQI